MITAIIVASCNIAMVIVMIIIKSVLYIIRNNDWIIRKCKVNAK